MVWASHDSVKISTHLVRLREFMSSERLISKDRIEFIGHLETNGALNEVVLRIILG